MKKFKPCLWYVDCFVVNAEWTKCCQNTADVWTNVYWIVDDDVLDDTECTIDEVFVTWWFCEDAKDDCPAWVEVRVEWESKFTNKIKKNFLNVTMACTLIDVKHRTKESFLVVVVCLLFFSKKLLWKVDEKFDRKLCNVFVLVWTTINNVWRNSCHDLVLNIHLARMLNSGFSKNRPISYQDLQKNL